MNKNERIADLEAQLLETKQALSEREAEGKELFERLVKLDKENREINIRLRQTHQERDEALKRETAHEARIEELENVVKSFLKEPYDDSDLKSLLKTYRTIAREVMKK